jgi:tRNA-modifying protein YgfZ
VTVETFPLAFAPRPRGFVRVAGPDAVDFLQRMVSNDVAALGEGEACDAMLLTPKARVIALLRVLRRADDDFLLLTEPELRDAVRSQLLRARFAAKVEIEPEEHASYVLLGGVSRGMPIADYGVPAAEVLDEDPPADTREADEEEVEHLRILARTPRHGRELDDRVLPAEAGLVERAVSLTKGCYPGQEPIARQHYRGRVNRTLRVLELDQGARVAPETEVRYGEKVVGRVTSAVPGLALAYVRAEVPDDAIVALASWDARVRPA